MNPSSRNLRAAEIIVEFSVTLTTSEVIIIATCSSPVLLKMSFRDTIPASSIVPSLTTGTPEM